MSGQTNSSTDYQSSDKYYEPSQPQPPGYQQSGQQGYWTPQQTYHSTYQNSAEQHAGSGNGGQYQNYQHYQHTDQAGRPASQYSGLEYDVTLGARSYDVPPCDLSSYDYSYGRRFEDPDTVNHLTGAGGGSARTNQGSRDDYNRPDKRHARNYGDTWEYKKKREPENKP